MHHCVQVDFAEVFGPFSLCLIIILRGHSAYLLHHLTDPFSIFFHSFSASNATGDIRMQFIVQYVIKQNKEQSLISRLKRHNKNEEIVKTVWEKRNNKWMPTTIQI